MPEEQRKPKSSFIIKLLTLDFDPTAYRQSTEISPFSWHYNSPISSWTLDLSSQLLFFFSFFFFLFLSFMYGLQIMIACR